MTRKKLIGWSVLLIVFFGCYNVLRIYLSMDAVDIIYLVAVLIATVSTAVIERIAS